MSYTGICVDGPLKGQVVTSTIRHLVAAVMPKDSLRYLSAWECPPTPITESTVRYQHTMWRMPYHLDSPDGDGVLLWDVWESAWVCGRDFR